MRSRWYHPPEMHSPPEGEGKKVSWLELFYDLVFVAAIIQLGDFLAQDDSLVAFGKFIAHFVPLWIAWSGFTFFQNRYNLDDFAHRILVLLKMVIVGTMAITSVEAIEGHPRAFAVAYAAAQAVIAAMHARAWVELPPSRDYSRYWGFVFGFGALSFLVSALVPTPWCYGVWAVGLLAILSAPLSKTSRDLDVRLPPDQEHLTERYGLLTIIVLGESFVKVLSHLSEHGAQLEYLAKGLFSVVLTSSLWWIYFDDVAGSKIRKGAGTWVVWILAHIPLTLAITALGVAMKIVIGFDLGEVAPASDRWLLAGSLALAVFSVALVDSVTERRNAELSDRNRVAVRVVSAVLVLLLAQVGATMNSATFLALLVALCIAQIVFDIMVAPLEETKAVDAAVSFSELARRRVASGEKLSAERQAPLGTAVRLGAPSEFRRDLYFFFIEGSWARVLMSFGFVYLVLAAVFAALYKLEAAPMAGDTEQSLADAFFFSVQTLTSLGYGTLSPATPWANVLVTIESAAGLLFAALATGLMFAKLSRPQSAVLFSSSLVLSDRNHQPTLMFRLANARGNEIVDATVSVTALVDEISPEGHQLRRLIDLKLVRTRSPVFTLTWTVMHVVDESSPLLEGLDDVYGLIVTLMGHDGTYGQTTYSRHIYRTTEVRKNHRFVDVISQLPDGRLMLQLEKFHLTEAIEAAE